MGTVLFPIPGVIPVGHPAHWSDSQGSKEPPSNAEIERNQTSADRPTPDNPYSSACLSSWPVPGGRPARKAHGGAIQPGGYIKNQPPPPSESSVSSTPGTSTIMQDGELDMDNFLRDMPTRNDDPARHVMFTELIRLKTKILELQIAKARQKEREAELELTKFKATAEHREMVDLQSHSVGGMESLVPGPLAMGASSIPSHARSSLGMYPLITHARPPIDDALSSNDVSTMIPAAPLAGQSDNPLAAMTPYDVEAMMQDSNLDGLFSWLPDFGESANTALDPSDLFFSTNPNPNPTPSGTTLPPSYNNDNSELLPVKKRSASVSTTASSPSPMKRTKRTEKKTVIERQPNCQTCSKPIARIMFRAPKSHIPNNISIHLNCVQCAEVEQPGLLPEPSTSGSGIGTVDLRKRMRVSVEVADEEKGAIDRRTFCDVCQRMVGSGRLIGGIDKESMSHIAEIVCASCDGRYQRCTDCGGGGGPRVGIGKWRMKQVFPPGRKTCSLSHTRLGDRPREIGVHFTPTDFNQQQLREVLTRCKGLWNEKTLARLAVPEMLEIDLPSDLMNPLRDYSDVEDIVTRNWPTREAMILADGADPSRFKRLLGLTWAHAKPRRTVRTVDLEEEYAKSAENEDDGDMSTVLANVKRTNIVIPAGSELVGMWGAEWDMQQGSLLISTLIPFEGADGEDSTALSVGEMITKVQGLRQQINSERGAEAKSSGKTADLLPQCQHLWVVSGGTMPLVRERVADVLVRKRSFVHVEEYLTRHPDFIHALRARPVGLHPDLHRPLHRAGTDVDNGDEEASMLKPLVLVRWLGKDFDAQKILEIKQQEFGGKTKMRRKSKSKG